MKKNFNFLPVTEKDKLLPYYLLSVGCDYIQEKMDRPEGFPTFQWIQCISGEGELVIEGVKERLKENQGMFLFPSIPHKYYSIGGEWRVNWISFDGSAINSFLEASGIKTSGVYYVKNSELLSSKLRKALFVSQSQSTLKNIEASSLIYELLMDILIYTSKTCDDSTQQQYSKLEPVFKFIDDNYSNLITLEDLAASISVTPQHFCLLFKATTQMRPFEYINNVRISKSKDLIISNSSAEINEIAKDVGYDNTSYFCSIFKKIEGISPGKFKKLYW
jgi:AraC-like DNA-binding protein